MMIELEEQDLDYVIEDDETQSPSDYSTEGDNDNDIQAEDSILVTSSERVVGTNPRDVANFIGYVVRTYASIELGSWKPAFEAKGEKILDEIKDKFKYPGNDERFESFYVATMRRMFRLWKNRLHKHYKSFSNDKERLKNTPDDLSPEQWKACIALFGSEKYKVDPVTGEKPIADIIWFQQHARKNADGQMEYNNEDFKRIGVIGQDSVMARKDSPKLHLQLRFCSNNIVRKFLSLWASTLNFKKRLRKCKHSKMNARQMKQNARKDC
ncbi:hypothetical protein CCACVL1_29914 [Corchorus capsularis]|uniref:Transposase, Ptta/En/Spm, plant n=1 Tax=Corchorus capsularis TaxID=210143 RepID=A0A1R3FZG4_COCAP|nr:hypothetical protein CCACVL1_29914 [Corchorus capsularis]